MKPRQRRGTECVGLRMCRPYAPTCVGRLNDDNDQHSLRSKTAHSTMPSQSKASIMNNLNRTLSRTFRSKKPSKCRIIAGFMQQNGLILLSVSV